MRHVLSRPRRCLRLLAGCAGVTVAYAIALAASFQAFQVHITTSTHSPFTWAPLLSPPAALYRAGWGRPKQL